MFAKLIRRVTGAAAEQPLPAACETSLDALAKYTPPAPAAPPPDGALRGSGSWDTDYVPAQVMQPLPRDTPARRPDVPARVAIHPKRLMSPDHLALYRRLNGRLETEAPGMTLHAHVAMMAFLHIDRRAAPQDRDAVRAGLAAESIDLLVLDDVGLPVVALEMADVVSAAKASALEEAGLGLVRATGFIPFSQIWSEVMTYINLDEDGVPLMEDARRAR